MCAFGYMFFFIGIELSRIEMNWIWQSKIKCFAVFLLLGLDLRKRRKNGQTCEETNSTNLSCFAFSLLLFQSVRHTFLMRMDGLIVFSSFRFQNWFVVLVNVYLVRAHPKRIVYSNNRAQHASLFPLHNSSISFCFDSFFSLFIDRMYTNAGACVRTHWIRYRMNIFIESMTQQKHVALFFHFNVFFSLYSIERCRHTIESIKLKCA